MTVAPKTLTTNNVVMHTATIEVKAMKIDNRQVTLAVFRQLPHGEIINFMGELEGLPWGRVNYHVDCEKLIYPHLHIVWQDGDELRRAVVQDWLFRFENPDVRDRSRSFTREELTIFERTWKRTYAQLEQLDQLFIAV